MPVLREVFGPHHARLVGSLLVLAALVGCAGATPGACRTSGDCAGSRVCVSGRCTLPSASGDAGEAPGSIDAGHPMPTPDAGPCLEVSAESTLAPVPIDIVVAIDNSGSMSEEASEVQRNMNAFATILGASGLDYRIVLISASAEDDAQGVCVPAPLGSGPPSCMGGPEGRLLALHVGVASHNAPDKVIEQYPAYRDFLRPGAAKVVLWITDDESSNYTADSFRAAMTALDPAFATAIHSSIVGFYGDTPATWDTRSAGSCGSLASVGTTYLRLAHCLTDADVSIPDCTPGRAARVCETDWTPVFMDIAAGVIAGVPVRCELEVPAAPMGLAVDPDAVSVTYRTTGGAIGGALSRVAAASECGPSGWYFDDAAAPTTITLCPDACRTVQADGDARLEVALGCFVPLM